MIFCRGGEESSGLRRLARSAGVVYVVCCMTGISDWLLINGRIWAFDANHED